ncbi:MAG: cytochrome c oxidase assembly protein [Candidatus Muproteobacteria bacterium RBG_16_62_13]|uniref:Cytochrome c oxidase assembly protein CtaG n=1 Tax=Candidatus Muproteobacteria bacterium RBG_16_62_13 TaxID=1817756 RepID=A0A1F6T0P3_9PROT|nr:MAG: cytochrome c oxidase assembly protein [Candidatus Muproteobacteria bacterium RBG_16_62_13]
MAKARHEKKREDTTRANRRLAIKLGIVTLAMFGFGYALAPMYDLMCQAFGLNGKTGRTEAQAAAATPVDTSRTVTVEFTGLATSGLPWEFKPMTRKLDVHPGETQEVKYWVRNTSNETITGQAVPSVAPGLTAAHFKKIECFCFSQQTLKPGEAREMPVRFVVEPGLDRGVQTITLSYTFFNTDKVQAKRYGGEALAQGGQDDHVHHAPSRAPGS